MEVPLFFSGFLVKFLGSNEEGIGVWGLYRGGDPIARGGATVLPPAAEPRAALTEDRFVNFFRGDRGLSPSPWATGPIFEISWNGHIFLKF